MPNCDFYAHGEDHQAVLDFVLSQPGWELWDSYSRIGHPLRRFGSVGDAVDAYEHFPSSHSNHATEALARRNGEVSPASVCDWRELSRASGRLNCYLRKLAVDKHGSRPILPGAQAWRAKGGSLT